MGSRSRPLLVAMCGLLALGGWMLRAAPPASQLFSTAVGSQWVYEAGPMELTEKIAAVEVVGGENCVRVDTFYNGKVLASEHLAVRPDGLYRVAIAGKLVEPPLCFLKYPAATGERWNVNSRIEGQEISGEFTLGESRLKIPAGEFQAISSSGKNFRSEGTSLEFTYYFVPGIGKVKQIVSLNGKVAELSLKEYRPAR